MLAFIQILDKFRFQTNSRSKKKWISDLMWPSMASDVILYFNGKLWAVQETLIIIGL